MSGTATVQCWSYQILTVLCVYLVSDLVVQNHVSAQPTQCGTVGHNLQSSQTRLTDLRFYLNSQNPAPCSGNVTTWEYCYYSPDVTAEDYRAPFGIYRLNGSNYELVSEMFLIIIPDDDIGSNSFTCRTFTAPVTAIQNGDVVGACVHDVLRGNFGGSRANLNLAGGNANGYSVQFADTSNRRCNRGVDVSVPNSVSQGVLLSLSSTVLHLYADIVSQPATTTERPTTMAETTFISTTEQQTTSLSDIQDTTSESDTTGTSTTTSDQFSTLATTSDQIDTSATTTVNMGTPGVIDTNDSSIGAIIGVVVALLLVLITIAVVVLAILLVVRNKKKDSYLIKNGASNPNAIDNAMYDQFASKAQLEASTYEIPVSNQPVSEHDYSEASTELTHTYDYTSFDPYEDVANSKPPSVSMYNSPLDSNAVSFSALLQKNQREDIYADLQPYRPPSTHNKDAIYGMIRAFGIIDIPRLVIRSVGHLGSGQFANVEEGTWKKGVNKEVRVALKEMHDGSSEQDKIKFLQEAAIMAQFRHPNVIALYGVVSKGDPVILVTELMEKGDLRHYLNSIRPDPGELPPADLPKLLLNFSQQVALGMQYLAGKGFVHRDLAARNILVSENKICKVSDFGMSRDLADETYYVAHGGMIPVKWTAPEALNYKKYSTASDVWSYGCLLYEIWSLGRKPFEGISNAEVIRLVESGRRLPPPPGCPKMIYQLMILCWNPATTLRPSFRDLVLTLVGNQQLVLSIPQGAIETHQLAGVLGAPLEAGEKMYQDLQYTYVNSSVATNGNELENDYEEFD